jgi:hypothetical protein
MDTRVIGYWSFEEGEGATIKNRALVGGGLYGNPEDLNGTIVGATWTSVGDERNRFLSKSTLRFDGDDYVEVPDSPSLNPKSITIELRVYQISRHPTDWTYLVNKNGYGSYHLISEDIWPVNQVCFTVRVGGSDYRLWTNKVIGAYWSYLAFTYDASTGEQRIYFNGELDTEESRTPGNIDTIAGHLRVTGSKAACFNGLIDEVAIFNVALPADEIRRRFEMGRGR